MAARLAIEDDIRACLKHFSVPTLRRLRDCSSSWRLRATEALARKRAAGELGISWGGVGVLQNHYGKGPERCARPARAERPRWRLAL